MARQLQFESELTICNVAETAALLLSALELGDDVAVDLSAVQRIDSAAVQLLVAGKKEAELKGVSLTWTLSEPLRGFAASIGVTL
jgi:anti-anti-sigma regulatory factor